MFSTDTWIVIALPLLLSLYMLHKLRAIHLLLRADGERARRDSAALFRQLEALQGLYVDLGLNKSLPGTRGWAASPDFLHELVRDAMAHKPRVVVECSSGTSTLVLARCMQINGGGKVYSLEHDASFARQTRDQLARHGLSDYAEVLDAPLREVAIGADSWKWYSHEALPAGAAIDMLVIDGPPMATGELARYPAGPLLFGQLAPGARVFLDDAKREQEQAILRRWKAEYPHLDQGMRDCEKGCAVLGASHLP